MKINYSLFHGNEKQKDISYGKLNPEHTFYVVQLMGNTGILTLLSGAMYAVRWAEEKGYIPVIDMMHENLRESDFSFFKYFIQRTPYTLDEVYQSQHVILSGTDILEPTEPGFGRDFTDEGRMLMYDFFLTHFDFTPKIWENVLEEEKVIRDRTLGVFLRGTDYTAMQPYYHSKQPEMEEVIDKISDFLSDHSVENIYLVTEDWGIYSTMKNKFGNLITITGGEEHFIKDYDGKEFIVEYVKDVYKQNIEYITRVILLSRCRWLIASMAQGSRMAMWLNNAQYEEMFLFEKGYYGV